jgi:hypothetical protein
MMEVLDVSFRERYMQQSGISSGGSRGGRTA